jgi:DUF4097 and DUF4098 domain-containing protein YvlB
MKPRSLIGPLLLILIGTLILLHNIRPDLVAFEVLARYWPYLLIIWGAIRLFEILAWWMMKKPLPRRGVYGGEWALVVLVCLIGTGLSVAHRHGARLPPLIFKGQGVELFGEAYDFPLSESKPVSGVKRLIIENLRGNTRIVGADVTEIKVAGRKTIRAYDKAAAEEASRQTPLEIVIQGEDVVVRTNQDKISDERRVSADLELTVPRNLSLRATGRFGDFDVVNLNGGIEIDSSNAGVRLQDIAGKVRVDLRRSDIVRAINVKGDVEVLGRGRDVELEKIDGKVVINGYYSGDLTCRDLKKSFELQSGGTELRFEKLPGQLHMNLGDFSVANVIGPLRLVAQNRDVRLDDFTEAVALTVNRGDVELRPNRALNAAVDVSTRSGNVELALPGAAKFELTATAKMGEVTNEYGEPLDVTTEGRGSVMKGAVGGGPKITIETDRGSITVRKE